MAFHLTGIGYIGSKPTATCFWDLNNQISAAPCSGCGPQNAQAGLCTNTCTVCDGDPSRSYVGGPGTGACQELGDQTSCEAAFHWTGAGGFPSSCFWDPNGIACGPGCCGCGAGNQEQGFCVDACPVCAGDPSLVLASGGLFSGACQQLLTQGSCENAFHQSRFGTASCFWDPNGVACGVGPTCCGCGPVNQGQQFCVDTCASP